MPILYCRIGYMKYYKGQQIGVDEIRDGGSYNEKNIGHEVYNFENYDGKYYGYVEHRGEMNIDYFGVDKSEEYVDGVTVIWIARKRKNENVIVGWYENARVYRNMQNIPENVLDKRDDKSKYEFNIYADKAVLVSENKRNFVLNKVFHNIWYNLKMRIYQVEKI